MLVAGCPARALTCLPVAQRFWRSEPYQAYFDWLDKEGGFYYEVRHLRHACHVHALTRLRSALAQRWGDAPVHSIGAALFAKKEQIHYFSDIGYRWVRSLAFCGRF